MMWDDDRVTGGDAREDSDVDGLVEVTLLFGLLESDPADR
jgi:hypothetical protein